MRFATIIVCLPTRIWYSLDPHETEKFCPHLPWQVDLKKIISAAVLREVRAVIISHVNQALIQFVGGMVIAF